MLYLNLVHRLLLPSVLKFSYISYLGIYLKIISLTFLQYIYPFPLVVNTLGYWQEYIVVQYIPGKYNFQVAFRNKIYIHS